MPSKQAIDDNEAALAGDSVNRLNERGEVKASVSQQSRPPLGGTRRPAVDVACSVREVEQAIAQACSANAAATDGVHIDVIENLHSYLCVLTFKPGSTDDALVDVLGATPYGPDCAMLVVPRERLWRHLPRKHSA